MVAAALRDLKERIIARGKKLAKLHPQAWLDLSQKNTDPKRFEEAIAHARKSQSGPDSEFIRSELRALKQKGVVGKRNRFVLEKVGSKQGRKSLRHVIPYFSITTKKGCEKFGYKESKPRVVWDATKAGLNARVLPPSDDRKLVYRNVSDLLCTMRPDTEMTGVDLSSAYHCLPLPDCVQPYFGVAIQDNEGKIEWYRATRYFFGLATSSNAMQVQSYRQIRHFTDQWRGVTAERW